MTQMLDKIKEQDAALAELQKEVKRNKKVEFKMEQPAKFGGERKELQAFTTALRAYKQHYLPQFPYVGDDVRFAASRLEGRALVWFEPQLREYVTKGSDGRSDEVKETFSSLDAFIDKLEAVFGDPDLERESERKLRGLHQTKSTAAYAAEFQQAASHLEWEDEPLMAAFYEGLKDTVKDEISKEDRPDTLTEYITKAVRIDQRLYERQQERQRATGGPRTYPRPRANEGRFTRRLPNESRPKRASTAYGTHSGPMDLSAATKEGGGRKKETRKCYNCDRAGHLAKDCRQPKKIVWQQNRNLAATERVPSEANDSKHDDPSNEATGSKQDHDCGDDELNWHQCCGDECVRHRREQREYQARSEGPQAYEAHGGQWRVKTKKELPFAPLANEWKWVHDYPAGRGKWYGHWEKTDAQGNIIIDPDDYITVPNDLAIRMDDITAKYYVPSMHHYGTLEEETVEKLEKLRDEGQLKKRIFSDWDDEPNAEGQQTQLQRQEQERATIEEERKRAWIYRDVGASVREDEEQYYAPHDAEWAYDNRLYFQDMPMRIEDQDELRYADENYTRGRLRPIGEKSLTVLGRTYLKTLQEAPHEVEDSTEEHPFMGEWHPRHGEISWVGCYDDTCLTHLNEKKASDFFPIPYETKEPITLNEIRSHVLRIATRTPGFRIEGELQLHPEIPASCLYEGIMFCPSAKCPIHMREKAERWQDSQIPPHARGRTAPHILPARPICKKRREERRLQREQAEKEKGHQ